MKKSIFLLFAVCCMPIPAELAAQTRAASPACTISQKVGLTDVTVVYSRPSKKERAIFAADGLVPYGKPWRTGANTATKITFSDDVKLGEQSLTKGDYTILTVPGASEWKVMLYPYDSGSWGSYVEKAPAISFTTTPVNLGEVSIETFMIDIGNLRDNSAVIGLAWDNVYVPLALEVK